MACGCSRDGSQPMMHYWALAWMPSWAMEAGAFFTAPHFHRLSASPIPKTDNTPWPRCPEEPTAIDENGAGRVCGVKLPLPISHGPLPGRRLGPASLWPPSPSSGRPAATSTWNNSGKPAGPTANGASGRRCGGSPACRLNDKRQAMHWIPIPPGSWLMSGRDSEVRLM